MAGEYPVVGVMPAHALAARARLFSALEQAHPVRFAARDPGATAGLDAAVVFPPAGPHAGGGLPALAFAGPGAPTASAARVRFSDTAELDRRLRGRRLVERHTLAMPQPAVAGGELILASSADTPLWLRRGPVQVVAGEPDELEPGEALRSRVRAGRFIELLPLVHFLREHTAGTPWDQPPLRACLVFDDPNLRRRGYGHIRYRELASHARRHGYHASIASIPLDYTLVDPVAAALFRENPGQLSICMHGNNHEHLELLRAGDEGSAAALLAQALRRAARLESRFGVRVCRVMCPPHEVCGEAATRAMFRLGFEALTIEPPLHHPPESSWGASLEGFEAVGNDHGLPVIPRYPLAADLEDLPLRTFLNLPLVVFGHHGDVRDGLDALLPMVEGIASLGKVRWMSLSSIARSNHLAGTEGTQLHVRLRSLLAEVPVPEGVDTLFVELPVVCTAPGEELVVRFEGRPVPIETGGSRPAHVVLPVSVSPGTARIQVASSRRRLPEEIPPPGRRVWPLVRRAAAEARDRTAPLRHRIKG
jgi:hypothetical protein